MTKKVDFTVIGSGSFFSGEIKVPHDLRIDGEFSGKIECGGTVSIGKEGVVRAEILAQNGEIAGRIEGDITCEKLLELNNGASIIGDLTAKELIVNKGAVLHGTSSMIDTEAKKNRKNNTKKNEKNSNAVSVEV
ncbi:MAG: bactofilin family protein [Fibrobacterota bacterium]